MNWSVSNGLLPVVCYEQVCFEQILLMMYLCFTHIKLPILSEDLLHRHNLYALFNL